jgi:hypothetical protein
VSLTAMLTEIAAELAELGEWEVHDATPQAINAPAVFPGGVESMVAATQDGVRDATLNWWVVYPATGLAETQRALYLAAERIWEHLDDSGLEAWVRVKDSVGSVDVAGTSYWGARLEIEAVIR